MFLKEFNNQPTTKINKLSTLLSKQFDISLQVFPSKVKLEKLHEAANQALIKIRGSYTKFHLEPDYAKFLGLRDLTDTMLSEGMYAESPAYESMCNEVKDCVRTLMDSGCTNEEAVSQCMNEYRKDDRFCYEDAVILPVVEMACEEYMNSCSESKEEIEGALMAEETDTDLNSSLFAALANEVGVATTEQGCLRAIEEKLGLFSQVSGKSRDSVVGFLNGLDEDALPGGIQMFGRKVAEQNKFTGARKDAIAHGKKEFEVDGKKYAVTGDTEDEKKQAKESMFDDLINDILNEEVDVEQAEVVMAVRALADDIQDQIERLGRMMNEDVPAIADQMRAEMGASQAQQWADATTGTLNGYMEAAKGAKAAMDSQVAGLSGEEQVGGLGDTGMEDPALGGDMGMDAEMPAEEPIDDVPAAAGPEEEPLGRAEI